MQGVTVNELLTKHLADFKTKFAPFVERTLISKKLWEELNPEMLVTNLLVYRVLWDLVRKEDAKAIFSLAVSGAEAMPNPPLPYDGCRFEDLTDEQKEEIEDAARQNIEREFTMKMIDSIQNAYCQLSTEAQKLLFRYFKFFIHLVEENLPQQEEDMT